MLTRQENKRQFGAAGVRTPAGEKRDYWMQCAAHVKGPDHERIIFYLSTCKIRPVIPGHVRMVYRLDDMVVVISK